MDKVSASSIGPTGIYEKLKHVSEKSEHVSFIFGAGASAGYSRNPALEAPPLVATLFDDSNSTVAGVIRQPEHAVILRRRDAITEELIEHGGDLEAYLGNLYAKHQDHELFTRIVLYLQDICFVASKAIDENWNTNNYLKLIYRMENLCGTKWSCVSFNYDTILEKTFVSAGSDTRRFSTFEQYEQGRRSSRCTGA